VTRRLMRLAVFMIFAILSMSAWGHCSIDDERRHLKVADVQGSGAEHVACKEHPDLHKDIWAVASPRDPSEDAAKDDYDLDVSLEDQASGKPVAHGHFKGLLWNGGGPVLSEIKIDTGGYFVAPGVQAFGIRSINSMTIFGVPTDGEELDLFVVNGKDIVNVLSHADMRLSYSNRGDACEEQRREVARVLVVDKTLTHGFRDLLVKETITDFAGKTDVSGRCRLGPTSVKTNEHRLKYDGSKYTVPRDMQEVDCGVC
jgi:hypothetical protein